LSQTFADMSLSGRFLFGTNRVKAFSEIQYGYKGFDKTSNIYLSLGSEINITDGLWVDFTGGLLNNTTDNTNSFVTHFNLKMTLPEKFKFF
jgi:hypothetical protein